jgi:tetratricopeptide (TPR) repeat protein
MSSEESAFLFDSFAAAAKDHNWEVLAENGMRLLAATTPPAIVYSWLFDALWFLDRPDEAEEIIDRGFAAFPTSPDILLKRARHAKMRGDYATAAHRWMELYENAPDGFESCYSAAFCLEKTGDVEGALRLLKGAVERQGPSTDIGLQYVTLLLSARGPNEARATWLDMFGANAPTPEQLGLREKIEAAEAKDLMMSFESLGGRAEGCEFGGVQRQYGAEPLGLLRWSDMGPDDLIAALEQSFEGVGDPANTVLTAPWSAGADWVTEDTRFGMKMHTFLFDKDTAENRDRIFRTLCRRLRFLKRKLLEDLAVGDKIFVYKISYDILDRNALDRLHRALRKNGPSTLLYVRRSDEDHPAGRSCRRPQAFWSDTSNGSHTNSDIIRNTSAPHRSAGRRS